VIHVEVTRVLFAQSHRTALHVEPIASLVFLLVHHDPEPELVTLSS
jgi:hypothetical protein